MGLRPEYSLGHSEFNDFLFASIGEKEGGSELTVLSALARLGLDPWKEAARLAELPKDAATAALAASIVRLPEGVLTLPDARSVALRLVDRLPGRGARPAAAAPVGRDGPREKALPAQNWLIWLAVAAVFLAVFW